MNDKEIDNILDDDDDLAPFDIEVEQIENIGGNAEVKSKAFEFQDLPEVLGEDIPIGFARIVERVHAHYKTLPVINHLEVHEELAKLSVEKVPTPTLQLISQELQKVQSVKERVSEIIRDIIPVHTMKKRHFEILRDAWIKFSHESAADKRKSDSVFRISEFESDFAAIDALYKTAMHVARNLESAQEILSRRITIISLELKMHDLGRHGLPDHGFTHPSLADSDSDSDSEIGRPVETHGNLDNGVLEAETLEF